MITNTALWLLTLARFQGFQVHIPMHPHEKHVEEFHSILDGFQSASKGDFSAFRIKDSDMNAPVPTFTGIEPVMNDYKYCDPSLFKGRVSGVVQYVIMVTSIHSGKVPSPSARDSSEHKQNNPATGQPSIYIENMHSSQLISSSPHASVKIQDSFNPKDHKFRELINLIKDTAPKLGLKDHELRLINAEVSTIEAQIESPAPKYTYIAESAYSIKGVLDSVAGNVLTQALFIGLGQFFSWHR